MKKELICTETRQTEEAGALLARCLLEDKPGQKWFVCLAGDLGAGKTAFVRGFASVISPGSRVKSPTYTVVNEYRRGSIPLFHFDLYRLEDGDASLDAIGFEEYSASGHCIIEWSEHLQSKPEGTVYVNIEKLGEDTRRISMEY